MAQMNGMELARKIRERNRRIQIAFLTGLPDFISEGYEVDALHYLIKPIQEKKALSGSGSGGLESSAGAQGSSASH